MDTIETPEGRIEVYNVNAGIEVYIQAATNDPDPDAAAESIDLILTRDQVAALIARLAAVLAEPARS